MRVTRSLMLFLAVAVTAGGCAQRPVMRVVAARPAPQGIDNVIYGNAPAAAVAAPPVGRGYIGSSGPAYAMAATPPYAPPAPAPPAAPVYRPPPPAPTYAAPVYRPPPPAPTYAAPAYRPPPLAPTYAAPLAPAPTYAAPAAATYAMAAAAAPTYAPPAAPGYAMPAAPAYGYGGMALGPRLPAAPVSYAPALAPPPPQYPYMLDSGDRLRVVVFGQDGLTNSYIVDASGQIQMPLIGSVAARGLSTDQLSQAIADLLRQGFVREPHVAVEVEAYRPFFILGEVIQPGQYPFTPNMTVETAVAIAGGFSPRALHGPVIVSHNAGGQILRFNAPLLYQVQPGDTIKVKERWF